PHTTLLGHGLMELLEHHLSELPSQNGSPFTLVVTIGIDALRSGLGVAALDTGHRISAGEARRLACRAGLIPMVLDGDSMPLDVGRERGGCSTATRSTRSTSATRAAPPTP